MKKLFIFVVLIVSMTACQQVKDTANTPTKTKAVKNLVSPKIVENFEGAERTAYQQPEKVIDYIGDVKGQTIMDLGAGTGFFTFRLTKAGAQVIAADINDAYLAYMELKADSLNVSHQVEIRKVPRDSPGLKPDEIDKFLIVNTYHHLHNRSDYFKKVKAGLKLNGEVIVIDFFEKSKKTQHPVSPDKVIAELKDAGFTEFDVNKELLEFQYILRAGI